RGKRALAAVPPETAGIRKERALEPSSGRKARNWRLNLCRCSPVVAASDIIHCCTGCEIARTEAVRRKSAHELRPAEKAAQQGHALAAKGRNRPGLQARARNNIVAHAFVGAQIGH